MRGAGCSETRHITFDFWALAARAPQGPYLGEVTVRRKACGRRGEVPYSESGFHLPLQLTLPPLSAGSDKRPFESCSIFLPSSDLPIKIHEPVNSSGA
jgi:hypothetical protein